MAFVSGSSTPFGLYDSDAQFAADADRLVKLVSLKLGGGLPGAAGQDEGHVQVELSSFDVYGSFESALTEYGAIINSYQARSSLAAWLGSATGTLGGGENKYAQANLEWARRAAQPFGEDAGVGGSRPLYSGSINVIAGQQTYDLSQVLAPTGSDGLPKRLTIRTVHHYSPLAAFRFFGTTSAVNYLNSQFNFESFTPETIFYLLPIWEDVLRGMQFKTSNRVRRSNYSYDLNDNVLKIYPSPTINTQLWITYNLVDDSDVTNFDKASYGVANVSNVPFGIIRYSALNSIARKWVWDMTLAMAKEILGYIRGKMSTVPIPDGDLTLDGDRLISDARGEMDFLRSDLRNQLEEMTYDRLAAKEAEKSDSLYHALSRIPLKIYTY